MSVKDIIRRHTVRHKGSREGQTTQVILRPYEKSGAFRVAHSGAGNTVDAEIACYSLDDIARYLELGNYLVRMKSGIPKVEGLYAANEIEIVR